MLAMVLKLSDFPLLFGLVASCFALVRVDFDKFLVAITRGFPGKDLEQIRAQSPVSWQLRK